MKTFISLCLMMGIIRLPARNDYWRVKESCWLAHTNFGKAMPRDRFNNIWRYLHLQNNEEDAGGDKIFKLRWFLNHLIDRYQSVYVPGPFYTVDEMMVKFKGRLSFRQYLPIKSIKWGVKLWTLCESGTGYTVNSQVYTGKDNRQCQHGLGYKVVMDTCVGLQGSQAQVYFDNYFSSVTLMNDLSLLGIQACGTVRPNRKDLPTQITPNRSRRPLPKHEFVTAQKNELSFVHWQDTKAVCVLSNFHDPAARGTVNRRVERRQKQQAVVVPKALADYQKYMGGVDFSDQMVGYYLLQHRSWKWWRRIFFHHLMVSLHNAFIVAKEFDSGVAKKEWPRFQAFVEAVAHHMATTVATRAPPASAVPRRATLNHKIERIFNTRKVCFVCQRKPGGQRPGATNFGCVKCREPCDIRCLTDHLRFHNSVDDAAAADDGGDGDSDDNEDVGQ